jgi:hypothetical protein
MIFKRVAKPNTKDNRTNQLTAANGCILEGFREFSSDWHHIALDNIALLSLRFDALVNKDVKALALETIEHIAKPLSVHMHPVFHIGEVAADFGHFDELKEL